MMFRLFIVLCICVGWSCARRVPSAAPIPYDSLHISQKPAFSFETAVHVHNRDEEMQWVATHHPGSRLRKRMTIYQDSVRYDVLNVFLPGKHIQRLHFLVDPAGEGTDKRVRGQQ